MNLTTDEALELLVLSTIVIPNMDDEEFNIEAAEKRQLELFNKASQPYKYLQD